MFLAEARSCSILWLHCGLGSQHTTHTFYPECATKTQNVIRNLHCMSWVSVLQYIPCSVHSRRHSLAFKYRISRTLDCIGFKHLIFKIAVWVAAFCLIFLIIEYIWAWEDFPAISEKALNMYLLFCTMYSCKALFSAFFIITSKYDQFWKSVLKILFIPQ